MTTPPPKGLRRLAFEEKVPTLYKFRAYTTDQEKAWVQEILLEHKIRFSRPSQLNDPHDLRPLLKIRRLSSDEETRAMLFADAEQVWARHQPPYTPDRIERMRVRLRQETFEQLEAEALARTHARMEAAYWVFSLATSRDWVHMWEDYANRGTGLCIHFKVDALTPFGWAQRVLYTPERPVLYVPLPDERDVTDAVGLTKTRRWEKEEEYRLIHCPGMDYKPLLGDLVGQHAVFHPSSIEGITVGPNMPDANVKEILAIAATYQPFLTVSRPTGAVVDQMR
jgi:hypothetical protein